MTFGLTSVVLLSVMGAAVDYSILSNSRHQSQSIADTVALNAAVFVMNNERKPENSDEGYVDGVSYSAEALGYTYKNWVKGGSKEVFIKVNYDDDAKEAVVTVRGKTVPTFTSVMGYTELDFAVESKVAYHDVDLKEPASIALILDNSGSMGWDDKKVVFRNDGSYYTPADAIPRIDGLQNSVKTFMATLDNLVGDQSSKPIGDRRLRTGMLAFNSDTINSRTVPMHWGTVSSSKVDAMVASGGTNSSPPMDTATSWLESEVAIHNTEHGRTPLRFAIFMTDGVNTSGGTTWIPEDETGYWRKYVCNNGCRYYYYSESTYPDYNFAGNGFEEGREEMTANLDTLDDCHAMAASGVKVYTIGFALEPGYYEENTYYDGRMQYEYTSSSTSNKAYAFLQGCASETKNFIKAENADTLDEAFQVIGNDIVTEIIRLKS